MLPLLALVLAAPVPKEDAPKPDAISDRHALLLRDNRTQRELGLTAERRVTLIDFFEAFDEENSRIIGMLYPPSGPGHTSKEEFDRTHKTHAEFTAKQRVRMQATVAANVTANQFARLRQLERRALSVFAFALPDTVAELKLTDGQIQLARKVAVEFREKYAEEYESGRKPTDRPPHDFAKPYLKRIADALSEAQAARWKELLGAEPTVAPVGTGISRAVLRIAAQTPEPGDR